jgi:putative ABC transport system substrate-binding protein
LRRRQLIAALLAAPLALRAQPRARIYRVALLSIGTDPQIPLRERMNRWYSFLEAMRELGLVEGRDFEAKGYFGDGKAANLPGLVAEMKRAAPDIIVTTGDREVIALRDARIDSTPTVFTFVADPVARGFVKSLARPGGNITGITTYVPGQIGKHVELLHEAVPSVKRFAIFASPSNTRPDVMGVYEVAARALGMTLMIANVSDRASYEGALERARKDGAQGIIVPMDGETGRYRHDLAELAIKHRLPGIYGDRVYVEAGGLMSFSSNWSDRLRRAAAMVDKIMKGADPGELPVEQPTKFELVVNLRTARALGLAIPQSILVRADEVIE